MSTFYLLALAAFIALSAILHYVVPAGDPIAVLWETCAFGSPSGQKKRPA